LEKKIVEWENVIVNLDNFKLEANPGYIRENEIIGVLGRNGIGKSTFVKTLAGEIKYEGKYIKKYNNII